MGSSFGVEFLNCDPPALELNDYLWEVLFSRLPVTSSPPALNHETGDGAFLYFPYLRYRVQVPLKSSRESCQEEELMIRFVSANSECDQERCCPLSLAVVMERWRSERDQTSKALESMAEM